jgi:hypothetical protein
VWTEKLPVLVALAGLRIYLLKYFFSNKNTSTYFLASGETLHFVILDKLFILKIIYAIACTYHGQAIFRLF